MEKLIQITDLIQNILAIIGILAAGVLGYVAINKSLKQDYVSKKITENSELNQNLQKAILSFIEKWKNDKSKFPLIDYSDLEQIQKDFLSVSNAAINCETRIANIAIVTSWFLDNVKTLIQYKEQEKQISREILYIIIQACDKMLFLSSKQIVFPSLWNLTFFVKKIEVYSKEIKPFVSDWKIKTMRFFNQGVNIHPFLSEIISITEIINRYNNPVFLIAWYRSINSYSPISILLLINKIYFPPVIVTNRFDPMINENWKLVLIGFSKSIQISSGRTEYYEFKYTTDRSWFGIREESLKGFDIENCRDTFLLEKESIMPKLIAVKYLEPNTVSLRISNDVLKDFSNNKLDAFKKKLFAMKRSEI